MILDKVDFTKVRQIVGTHEIPHLSGTVGIRLLRTNDETPENLRAAGAKFMGDDGWFITRDAPADLIYLESHLPRFAQQFLVPNVVDLIPSTSWFASLANLLTPAAWGVLRDECIAAAGGCEDCGTEKNLECHEIWAYDEDKGVQTLESLRSVCGYCHEGYHLGLANVRNRYCTAFNRLCTINRIEDHERSDYDALIFEKYLRRSDTEWVLNLGLLEGKELRVRGKYTEIAPGLIAGESGHGEIQVGITGVTVRATMADGEKVLIG
ncbi:hypothetical protein [Erythrobacter aureus]|uniref:Uncharacterized protein n=1 Tax=Erythrobacter aureus TaxID=2182384 RepID=A0A345YJH6_9SPHN|nr:hypothetical protein [Erythrobacter aureus]AXK44078.1 hypothetical protein DVR09_16630 [Erythrobacter aureus]